MPFIIEKWSFNGYGAGTDGKIRVNYVRKMDGRSAEKKSGSFIFQLTDKGWPVDSASIEVLITADKNVRV